MSSFEVHYAIERTGIAGFADAWTRVGGTVTVTTPLALLSTLTDWCGDRLVLAGPQFTDLPAGLRWPCAATDAARADCAVVETTCAIAQTGTVVLDAARNRGRALSLLPPRVAFVVDATRIVDTPAQVLRDRRRWWPERPPSQIVFVSGPSRSADIEMTLTIGVHGPGEVHAVIVDG